MFNGNEVKEKEEKKGITKDFLFHSEKKKKKITICN